MASATNTSIDNTPIRTIAVLLAANVGTDPKYKDFARQVATMFAKNRWRLVYGGSARGLMGILGQTASALGVDVHGIKPRPFLKYEVTGELPDFGHQELVEDLYTQKTRMAELSDAFLILPGGFGTLEEYATIRMWSKLGVCPRPIVLLNFENFYTPLLDWITKATALGFISNTSAAVVTVVDSIDEINDSLSRPRLESITDNDDHFDWSVVVPRDSSFSRSEVENSLFETADQISLQHSLTVHWSTWHTWDYYNRLEPDTSEASDRIWKEISPFATCVGMAFMVARNLRAALENTPGMAQCSQRLKTVACPISVDSRPPYHSLTGVFMDQYCVIIDLIFSAKAFKVPYKGSFETLPYITTSGSLQQRCYRYLPGPNDEKVLTMEKVGSNEAAVQFTEIDHSTALRDISMRAARETKPGLKVPNKKLVVVRSLMDEKPTRIAFTPLNADFIVTACRVQLDFDQETITMQVPLADWLLKSSNERYLSRVQASPIFSPVNEAVVNLVVDLSSMPNDLASGQLRLMGEVGERFGLASGEILRMSDSLGFVKRRQRC